MKIDAVDFSKELQQELGNNLGLEDIKMSRLGQLVAVAGANGAGKSRLFKLLVKPESNININNQLARKDFTLLKEQETHHEKVLKDNTQFGNNAFHIDKLELVTQSLKLFEAIKTEENLNFDPAVYSIEKTDMSSANIHGIDAIHANSQVVNQIGSKGFGQAPSYLQSVFSKANNANVLGTSATPSEIKIANEAKNSLQLLIEQLLGFKDCLVYKFEGHVTLFGFKDYEKKLSNGQIILFQLACALHAQGTKLNEAIIFFDEPENHLHPAALIEVVDRLVELTDNGQLWIATHSVPLIAHLAKKDPNCLWYMENGSVQHAGRKPELVLQGLMGGQAGVQALQDFTLLPSQLAINRFLAECLNPPTTVSASVNDPQTSDISKKIHKLRTALKPGAKLRILDYGAGKGRLLDALQAIDSDTDLKTWLDYLAYDPFEDDKTSCTETICRTYDTADGRYYNRLIGVNSLSTSTDDCSYDLIVMCNVLHEISPDEWLNCFGNSSKALLAKLLKPSGGLLVVEDYQIPTGELAHKHGFLLLDEPELKALFAWKETDTADFIRDSAQDRYKDRLVMHWIAQPLLERVTDETRRKAISTLKDNANDAIDRLQQMSSSSETFSRGHQIALASQTYTNAARWIEKNPK